MLENVTKHNAISADNPLQVSLTSDGGKIIVRNKRIPKVNYSGASTGIGLQYIRNQYRDIAGAEIEVEETPDSFTVTVPILKNFE